MSVPCWTEDNLITERTPLSESVASDLLNLIEEVDFDRLDAYYGPDNSRCHSHKIEVVTNEISKTVDYCSAPNGPEEPEAFRIIREKLQEIIGKEFEE